MNKGRGHPTYLYMEPRCIVYLKRIKVAKHHVTFRLSDTTVERMRLLTEAWETTQTAVVEWAIKKVTEEEGIVVKRKLVVERDEA